MKEAFEYTRIAGKVMMMIENANRILDEYAANGYTMTLRMLHYQFVSRDLYANTQNNYKKLGHAMTTGRLMGLVDWDHLEDRQRELSGVPTWAVPKDIIESSAWSYREKLWLNQDYWPELWIEKDALSGVIARACNELRVDYFACRGYVSASAQYGSSKRFQDAIARGQTPIVFHMGDHDPSGLDMTRDNTEYFELLTGEPVEVRRIALNMDQIKLYDPPPNPTKFRPEGRGKGHDSRSGGYMRRYGKHSWELDALPPDVLNDIVRTAIRPLIDTRRWQASLDNEREGRDNIQSIANHYDSIVKAINRGDFENDD